MTDAATEVPDFLLRKSELAVKRELRGILQSYHHFWDILAELLQNSRDGIARRRGSEGTPPAGRIHVMVDAVNRTIEVIDNGSGIRRDFIEEVLSPGGSDKDGDDSQVGEKGVGLTYVAFSSNDFLMETRTEDEATRCTLVGASTWVNSASAPAPTLNLTDLPEDELPEGFDGTFTRVRLQGVPSGAEQDLFSLTGDELKWLLRTRTAVGDTRKLLRGEELPEVEVRYTWRSATDRLVENQPVEVGYPDVAGPKSVTIEEVNRSLVAKTSKVAKEKYLKSKVVTGKVQVGSGRETVYVYGAMLPGNKAITEDLAQAHRLNIEGLVQPGIFVVTKSMPTGVMIDPAAAGAYPAYYRRCIFLVDYDRINFDMGRKSIPWQFRNRLQQAVFELFSQFEKVAKYQLPLDIKPPTPTETPAERRQRMQNTLDEAGKRADLKWPGISFTKVPTEQEAAVAALFHELVGAKQIKGYEALATGYSTQYDLIARYTDDDGSLPVVIEFKDRLQSVLQDFRDGVKSKNDIDILVCWDFQEHLLKQGGMEIDIDTDCRYDGVTHQLYLPDEEEGIPVINLRTLRDRAVTEGRQ